MTDRMQAGQSLQAGQQLVSPNGRFILFMQPDGNLVLYNDGVALGHSYWSTATHALPAAIKPLRLDMQRDGNLVLYDANGAPRWSAGTWGPDFVNPYVVLQDDGNLVVYHNNTDVIWATGNFPNFVGRIGGRGFITTTLLQAHEWKDLGANHFMETKLSMNHAGHIDATTRTWTGTWLGGFTGGVSVLFSDKNGIVIGQSEQVTFGVDGTIIGRADRTDYWTQDIAPDLALRVASVIIMQYWAPKYDALKNIIAHSVQAVEPVGTVLTGLKTAGII